MNSWLDIFDYFPGEISLQMMIETVVQRSENVVCTLYGVKKCVMYDYLRPRKFIIFNSEHEHVSKLYKMVGITTYSPGHFSGDVFNPTTQNWLHFNSLHELGSRNAGFTLEPILKKFLEMC